MMVREELIFAILEAVAREPGVSAHRLAKDLGVPLVEMLRELSLLAADGASIEGPAPLTLTYKSDTSLVARARLSPAGEALWAR
jgi:hypothetical protein